MKKLILLTLMLVIMTNVNAQKETKQKVIIDVTSTDFKVYRSVILTLNIMSESHPEYEFDVMVYGEAVPMLMERQSVVSSEIKKLINKPQITFYACEVSMDLFKIDYSELIEGVQTVSNALADIVIKQNSGWAYIKSAN